MESPQTALLAALRLLRTLLRKPPSPPAAPATPRCVLDRRRASRNKPRQVLSRNGTGRGGGGGDDDRSSQGNLTSGTAAADQQERRRRTVQSDGSLLRGCPVDVFVGVIAVRQQQPDLCGRRGGGEGLSCIPGQNPGPATTGDLAGECHCQRARWTDEQQQCLCPHSPPGGDALERGSSCDRVQDLALDGLGHASGCPEASAQLPQRQGSRVHLLQPQPLVSGLTTG